MLPLLFGQQLHTVYANARTVAKAMSVVVGGRVSCALRNVILRQLLVTTSQSQSQPWLKRPYASRWKMLKMLKMWKREKVAIAKLDAKKARADASAAMLTANAAEAANAEFSENVRMFENVNVRMINKLGEELGLNLIISIKIFK